MYQQKICYVDLYKNGFRCGNMGHVRTEWKDRSFRVQAYLCHLDRQTLATASLDGEKKVGLGNVEIIHGKGVYLSEWMPVRNDLRKLVFEASGGVYGICRLPDMKEEAEEETAESDGLGEKTIAGKSEYVPIDELQLVEPKQQVEEREDQIEDQIKEAEETEWPTMWIEQTEEPEQLTAQEKQMVELEHPATPEEQAEKEQTDSVNVQNIIKRTELEQQTIPEKVIQWHPQELHDTKWDQLSSMFPRIYPIEGDVEFLQIAPKDFVILRQEYQGLIRNSFLLHGYYNYNHLILGKYPDKYYIGVPGIMHEQERLAAAMFGFIGFERARLTGSGSQGRQNAENRGKEKDVFGYYMMEVGI